MGYRGRSLQPAKRGAAGCDMMLDRSLLRDRRCELWTPRC